MLTPRSTLTRRIVSALDASPSRIPVLVGGCGSGRTTLLQQLRDRLGRTSAQYIDVERTATTPERFLRAVAATAPFPVSEGAPAGARGAFDATLAFLRPGADRGRRAGDVPARRVPRAADVRKLSRPAPRAPRVRRQPGVERQPVRADQPLHGAHDAAAARRVVSLRSHSRAGTYGRGHARHPGPGADRRTPGQPSSSRGPFRRWPTAAPPTCTPSPKSWPRCASTAAARRAAASTIRSARSRRCWRRAAGWRGSAASATSCACTARAATAR